MEADRWIERVNAQRTHLPESVELAALEVELRGLMKDLQGTEARLEPIKSAYDNAARDSDRLRARASDLDKTLSASTANARELNALQHELTHVRELLDESEDRELELLMALEPLQREIDDLRARAQPSAARRAELLEVIAQLRASLDEELVALRRDRAHATAPLEPELLARYEAAFAHAGVSGAAQVVEGRCDGCRLALSPLDLDRFKAEAPDAFMVCPECGRLLLP
jgi:uncharacterized protein